MKDIENLLGALARLREAWEKVARAENWAKVALDEYRMAFEELVLDAAERDPVISNGTGE